MNTKHYIGAIFVKVPLYRAVKAITKPYSKHYIGAIFVKVPLYRAVKAITKPYFQYCL